MKLNRIKLIATVIFGLLVLAIVGFRSNPVVTSVSANQNDAAATYKTKCAMCHSPKADKFFDPAKTDVEHVETIMKGKKGEKPPFMPGFEAKGMKPEEAKALTEYMRTLKTPAN